MNMDGLLIGLCTFLIIGAFHPVVIKLEYHFGVKSWWVFPIAGIPALIGSLLVSNSLLSAALGVFSFSCFWSILEIFEQKKRVEKGWFPRKPSKN